MEDSTQSDDTGNRVLKEIVTLDAYPQSQHTRDMAEEQLRRERQKYDQRKEFFCFIIVICGLFYVAFLYSVGFIFTVAPNPVLLYKPYLIFPVSLLGIIPTVIVIAVLKGIYKSEDGDEHKDLGKILYDIIKGLLKAHNKT